MFATPSSLAKLFPSAPWALCTALLLSCSSSETGSSGAGSGGTSGLAGSGGTGFAGSAKGGSSGLSGAPSSGGAPEIGGAPSVGGAGASGGDAGTGGGAGSGGFAGASGGAAGGGAASALSTCGTSPAKTAPALPAPTGAVVEVSTAAELMTAVGSAADGTTILMNDGTYYLPDVLRFRNYKRNVTLRSKSGNRDSVIIDGSQSASKEMIWFEEVENVTVADVTVQNAEFHCLTVKGEADANGVRIYNCRIHNCWERGVKGTAPWQLLDTDPSTNPDPATRPRNGRIEYCLFEEDYKKVLDDPFNGDYIAGIDMMWLSNWVISDNVFRMIQGRNNGGRPAIFFWNDSEDVTVERNLIVDCDRGIGFGNPSGAPLHMTRGILRNNFVVRGADKAIELVRTKDCQIYNNSVYSDLSFDRAFHSFQGSDGIHIFNNLVQAPLIRVDDTVPAGAVENNTVADLTGYFVDPTIADLHLTATGAAAVLGGGLAVPSGLGDYDDELRPSPPSVGADECAP